MEIQESELQYISPCLHYIKADLPTYSVEGQLTYIPAGQVAGITQSGQIANADLSFSGIISDLVSPLY